MSKATVPMPSPNIDNANMSGNVIPGPNRKMTSPRPKNSAAAENATVHQKAGLPGVRIAEANRKVAVRAIQPIAMIATSTSDEGAKPTAPPIVRRRTASLSNSRREYRNSRLAPDPRGRRPTALNISPIMERQCGREQHYH
ncbi:MAG: hypothetical protein ACXWLX_04895 [Rhizomicrobium sp.]